MEKTKIVEEIDNIISLLGKPAINTKQLISKLESLKGMVE